MNFKDENHQPHIIFQFKRYFVKVNGTQRRKTVAGELSWERWWAGVQRPRLYWSLCTISDDERVTEYLQACFLIYKSRTLEYMTLSPCQFKILRFLRQPLQHLKRLHDPKSDSQGCALVVRKILLRHSPTRWDGSGEKQERHVLCDMRVASEKKGHSLFH